MNSKKLKRPDPWKSLQTIKMSQPWFGDEMKAVSALRLLLQERKKVVVISGAGLSVNAGSKPSRPLDLCKSNAVSQVPDFQTLRGSARSSFDASVYCSGAETRRFYAMLYDLQRQSMRATPTAFHHFVDSLARNGSLLRHYTQNIDCIESRLPNLEKKTLRLHGRIDQARCQYCACNVPLMPDWFQAPDFPDCSRCRELSIDRERRGKRALRVNRLRPNIVLYGEEYPTGEEVEEAKE